MEQEQISPGMQDKHPRIQGDLQNGVNMYGCLASAPEDTPNLAVHRPYGV
jgi:hypothetical protein